MGDDDAAERERKRDLERVRKEEEKRLRDAEREEARIKGWKKGERKDG